MPPPFPSRVLRAILLLTALGLCPAIGCRRAPAPEATGTAAAGSTETAPRAPFGGLATRVIGDGTGPVVVLLHGYGTPPDDLVPLAEALRRRPALAGLRYVVPAGRLSAGPGVRLWWPLPSRQTREAQAARGERDPARDRPPELPPSRAAVLALLADVEQRWGVPPSRIALGGFSQGAMLAVDAALRSPQPIGAVFSLSGSIVAEEDWPAASSSLRGVPVLLAHGRRDDILPFAGAGRLRARLEEQGAEVSFLAFDDGHTIPPEVLEALATFLTSRFVSALPSAP